MPTEKSCKPNIVFILTDDLGYWALGAYGNSEAKTPNLDKLAEEGMRFDNFFCVSPVCSPARASLLTGRIPSRHGVHDYLACGDTYSLKEEPLGKGTVVEYLAGQPGYTDFLAAAGYTCGISGKWHLGDCHHPQKNFSYWKVHAKGSGQYYNAPMVEGREINYEKRYITDVFTDNAMDFMEQQKESDNPFYLSLHFTAPHGPWSRDNHPKAIYDDFHYNCAFESAPDGIEPAEWIKYLAIPVKDQETRRNYLSGYYAAIEAMDGNVGRIVKWLDDAGLRESTVICFTSDNGMNMGHHGVFGKGNATFPFNMYEESVKVPFIMNHPGRIPAGATSDELLSHYDFMPTILDYAAVEQKPADNKLPGKSFVGLLNGGGMEQSGPVVVFDEYGPVRMIRDKHFKYIHRYPYGPFELYDLLADPDEENNLYGLEEYADKCIEMRDRLNEWFTTYADPDVDGAVEPVDGSGQLYFTGRKGVGEISFDRQIIQKLKI